MNQDEARIWLAEAVGDPAVIFVTGKGGVGKSTVARLICEVAERASMHALFVTLGEFASLELGTDGPDDSIGVADDTASDDRGEGEGPSLLGDDAYVDEGKRYASVVIEPSDALLEYLKDHGFGKIASRLLASGIVGVVSTAIPGIKDILLLGKVKQLEKRGEFDLIVVDSPASGHALSFLTSPEGLRQIAAVGPLRAQSDEVGELLTDHARTAVVVVTIPEETPVIESLETIATLEGRVGMKVASIVVNQRVTGAIDGAVGAMAGPSLEGAATERAPDGAASSARSYWEALGASQDGQVAALRAAWSGPLLSLPFVPEEDEELMASVIRTLPEYERAIKERGR